MWEIDPNTPTSEKNTQEWGIDPKKSNLQNFPGIKFKLDPSHLKKGSNKLSILI